MWALILVTFAVADPPNAEIQPGVFFSGIFVSGEM